MTTPEQIRQKAEKQYPEFLKAWLRNMEFFPLDIPANKGKSTDPYLERTKALAALVQKSKTKQNVGYTLEMKTVRTRERGEQSVVSRIFFASRTDYLGFLDKAAQFAEFCNSVALIRSTIPQLDEWIGAHLRLVIRYGQDWPALLAVCRYFMEHPAPRLYIRELPVAVHTKFIETRRGVLKALLDFLLPAEAVNPRAADFAGRYKLRKPESLFRIRFLDPGLSLQGMQELAMPLSALRAQEMPVHTVVIIENLMTFLTFPPVKEGLAIWGRGFKAHKLREITWFRTRRLFYWGDIDPPGFEILSAVRRHFPHVVSFLMDFPTYREFSTWAVPAPGVIPRTGLYLTPAEAALYAYLLEHPAQARLEQERITQDYIEKAVKISQI